MTRPDRALLWASLAVIQKYVGTPWYLSVSLVLLALLEIGLWLLSRHPDN